MVEREIESARERNGRVPAKYDTRVRDVDAESWGERNLSIRVLATSTYVSTGVRGQARVGKTGRVRTYKREARASNMH